MLKIFSIQFLQQCPVLQNYFRGDQKTLIIPKSVLQYLNTPICPWKVEMNIKAAQKS